MEQAGNYAKNSYNYNYTRPYKPQYKQALSWQEPGPANNEKKLQESDEMEQD